MNIKQIPISRDECVMLIKCAIEKQKNSYAPYSGYNVSAAVLMSSGKIYTGVNVENASYPAGICAERNAIFHAVSEGETEIKAIAIIGGHACSSSDHLSNEYLESGYQRRDSSNNENSSKARLSDECRSSDHSSNECSSSGDYCPPCGICRQVMREFCDPEKMIVIIAKSETDYKIRTLEELLPDSFGPEMLSE